MKTVEVGDSVAAFDGFIGSITQNLVTGWAADRSTLDQSVIVEVFADGRKIGSTRADLDRPDLREKGFGNGRHGFEFRPERYYHNEDIRAKISGTDYWLKYNPALRNAKMENRYSQYYANEKRRIAYLNVPKCACTSLKALMLGFVAPQHIDEIRRGDRLQSYVHSKEVARQLHPVHRPLGHYFIFTFVRNPYDRFISFYYSKILLGWDTAIEENLTRIGLEPKMPFAEVVDRVVSADPFKLDTHIIPQHLIVCQGNEPTPDFVGKLENVNRDVHILFPVFGKPFTLVHFHETRNKSKTGWDFYTNELRDRIHRYYKEDFELFGYSKQLPSARISERPVIFNGSSVYVRAERYAAWAKKWLILGRDDTSQ